MKQNVFKPFSENPEAGNDGQGENVRVSELGQFPLIERLARIVMGARPEVVVGIGDDAAALDLGGEKWLLASGWPKEKADRFRVARVGAHGAVPERGFPRGGPSLD